MTGSGAPSGNQAEGREQRGVRVASSRFPRRPPSVPTAWPAALGSPVPVPGPAGLLHADVANRVVALFIDALLVFAATSALGLLVFGVFGTELLGLMLWLLVSCLLSAAYFVYSWSSVRATAGMKLLGLQIGHERDGRPVTREHALARWAMLGLPLVLAQSIGGSSEPVGAILATVGLVWLLVLLYSIAMSPGKQGYHDRVARTVMVKAPRRWP
jgi:uncharacterized RDD family membrane protein YckC